MLRQIIFITLCIVMLSPAVFAKPFSKKAKTKENSSQAASDLEQYVAYFHKVFDVMTANYYESPDPQKLTDFIEKFKSKIYPQLMAEGKSNDYVRWRATWYLVDSLKTKDDKFSQFYPPKPAEEFQHEALGQRVDLGIEGKKQAEGYLVTRLEPRADAYEKGLRENDVIVKIDGKMLNKFDQTAIENLLNPVINTQVALRYQTGADRTTRDVTLISKEYFKQTVFSCPVSVPGIACLEIPKFNRTTGDDLFRFLSMVKQQDPQGLVLDLRGNPGGPPLAAREISSFFLRGGDEFAYFQRRGQDKASLDVPSINESLKFTGPIVILVNADSGSAAELFTGIMQFRKRALVIGETTAGQVLLKSMFPIDDGAMVALITSLGYYPDNTTFGFKGITPDKIIVDAPKDGLINLAAAMILYSQHKL